MLQNISLGIDNNIALITGAGSGIGASCASIFSNAGANLVLVDRHFDDQTAKLEFGDSSVDYFTMNVVL